jgi:phage terminase small subunit
VDTFYPISVPVSAYFLPRRPFTKIFLSCMELTTMKRNGLTDKEAAFVREYLCDLNATQACIRSGYKVKNPDIQGFKLLRKPKISAEISAAQAKRFERLEITADNVLREIACLGFQNAKRLVDAEGRFIPLHDLPDDVAKTISSIDFTDGPGGQRVTKIRLCDKRASLELLGRNLKLFIDRVELSGNLDIGAAIRAARKRVGIPE